MSITFSRSKCAGEPKPKSGTTHLAAPEMQFRQGPEKKMRLFGCRAGKIFQERAIRRDVGQETAETKQY